MAFEIFGFSTPLIRLDFICAWPKKGTLLLEDVLLDSNNAKHYHGRLLDIAEAGSKASLVINPCGRRGWTARTKIVQSSTTGLRESETFFYGKKDLFLSMVVGHAQNSLLVNAGWKEEQDEAIQTVSIQPGFSTFLGVFKRAQYSVTTLHYRMKFSSPAAIEGLAKLLGVPLDKPIQLFEALCQYVSASHDPLHLGQCYRTTKTPSTSFKRLLSETLLLEASYRGGTVDLTIYRPPHFEGLFILDEKLLDLWKIANHGKF